MYSGDVETFYSGNQWHNRIVGTAEVFGTAATRGEAVWAGRARARREAIGHAVREIAGQVEQRHNYSGGAGARGMSGGLIGPGSIILAELSEPRTSRH